MKKETTYQRYRRENIQMKSIINIDVRRFIVSREDYMKRLAYLRECMETYRHSQSYSQTKGEKDGS